MSEAARVTAASIAHAHELSRASVLWTPVLSATSISRELGGKILLKAENLQRTGSFKLRGAFNKLRGVSASSRTVVAGSAGNHAQALAYAARASGLRCTVFMPVGAAVSKVAAVRAFGAEVHQIEGSVDDCVEVAKSAATSDDTTFVHPFDDHAIITGQGGVGVELAADIDDLQQVVVPVGGGGLASGVAVAVKSAKPSIRVVGVQAKACPPFAHAMGIGSFAQPPGDTIADGIAIKRPGDLTLEILGTYLDDVVTVSEDVIADAMLLLMERGKLVVEGAGAISLGAMLAGDVLPTKHGTTALILSGGNVDLGVLSGLARRNETVAGRRTRLMTRVEDRPGALAALLATVASTGANLIDVSHVRDGLDLDVRETAVELAVDTAGHPQTDELLSELEAAGYAVSRLDPHWEATS